MEFEYWWLLALPLFFGLGWVAARIDIKHLLRESRGPASPSREEVTVAHSTPTGEQAQLSFDTRAESFIGTCPDCGSQLEYAEGCVKCHVCGFSECG